MLTFNVFNQVSNIASSSNRNSIDLRNFGYFERGGSSYNGNKLPASDYWYVADVKRCNVSFQVKGHFTLRR